MRTDEELRADLGVGQPLGREFGDPLLLWRELDPLGEPVRTALLPGRPQLGRRPLLECLGSSRLEEALG